MAKPAPGYGSDLETIIKWYKAFNFQMDPQILRIWLNALRSGIFKKTYGSLIKSNGCVCAQGALLSALEVPTVEVGNYHDPHYIYDGVPYWSSAPHKLVPIHVSGPVAFMNDSLDLSFEDIATVLEHTVNQNPPVDAS